MPKDLPDYTRAITVSFEVPTPAIQPVEEQYEPVERKNLSTSTTETSYEITTEKPKAIVLIAYDQDHYIEFNQSVDEDSTLIRAEGSLSLPGKGVSKIYAKTLEGTGKLHIRVWKR